MKVGVIGAGRIGGTIAKRLAAVGHEVKIANSRGPETIDGSFAQAGVQAVTIRGAVEDADVVITSIPFPQLPGLRDALDTAPPHVVVIDTSNYFPFKDGHIPDAGAGQVESEWVARQLGRPIVKAWNNILAGSFATKATGAGAPGRIALAVAGDDAHAKQIAMQFVEITGFDALDAGAIADSWRQQPGSPAYCTELDREELRAALARAERTSLAEKRELMVSRMLAIGSSVTNDDLLRIGRETYL